jgi:hypothetical protein
VDKRHDLSVHVGVTNASVTLALEYYDAVDNLIGTSAVMGTNAGTKACRQNLSDQPRLQGESKL